MRSEWGPQHEGKPDLAEGTDYPNPFAIDIDSESAEAWIPGPLPVLEDLDRPPDSELTGPSLFDRLLDGPPVSPNTSLRVNPSGIWMR